MTVGSVFPDGNHRVLTVGKAGSGAIAKGDVCVPDTSTTPDSYKQAPASAGNKGPFVVCVNKDAAASDTSFAAAFPGTLVTVTAGGAIEAGMEVQCDSATAGRVVAFVGSSVATPTAAEVLAVQADRLRVVGRYIGKEVVSTTDSAPGYATGRNPAVAAVSGDAIIIRLGAN